MSRLALRALLLALFTFGAPTWTAAAREDTAAAHPPARPRDVRPSAASAPLLDLAAREREVLQELRRSWTAAPDRAHRRRLQREMEAVKIEAERMRLALQVQRARQDADPELARYEQGLAALASRAVDRQAAARLAARPAGR